MRKHRAALLAEKENLRRFLCAEVGHQVIGEVFQNIRFWHLHRDPTIHASNSNETPGGLSHCVSLSVLGSFAALIGPLPLQIIGVDLISPHNL